ncbi:DMT family transporter [Falsiroseomonas ponticola]|uniref:DMT family transporter n=1 Tax=Falsiroseomonas ponticola TaxID=2786951 RepID=UPI001CF7E7AF|nr:DMT family transporter [Roseomonas ponticola]
MDAGTAPQGEQSSETRRLLAGMGLMLACCLSFAAMGACFRAAMQDGLPVPLVPFARGLFTTLVMLPWLLRAGPSALHTRRPGAHLFRCAAGLVGFMVHMLAILWLPLADAVAIMHARPLWALPLAFLLLGEKVGWDRAIAAAIGFTGVLVIAGGQSGFQGEVSAGTLAALLGGLTGALVLIAVKTLSSTEPPARVVAWYALASVIVWGPVSAFVWQTPTAFAAMMLVAGSVLAILGDFCASWAARRAPVGLLAPIEYVQIPASAVIAMLAFAERPGWELVWGTLIMVAATLYLARSAGRPA